MTDFKSLFVQHHHNKVFVLEGSCSFWKLVIVISLTETVVLFTLWREEWMQQVLAVTGNPIKKLIVGVITDAAES